MASTSLPLINGGFISSSQYSSLANPHQSANLLQEIMELRMAKRMEKMSNFEAISFLILSTSSPISRWGWRRDQEANMVINRTRGQAFQILANPNVSSGKRGSNNEVIMVDPLEAKQLAAKQMQEIKAKEKFQRRRQIEAINGAWAMIGLTAGLVIEGQTGKSILMQLAEYWSAIVHFFVQ